MAASRTDLRQYSVEIKRDDRVSVIRVDAADEREARAKARTRGVAMAEWEALGLRDDELPGGETGGGFKTLWSAPDPVCQFCREPRRAHYDGATRMGPWALMCDEHFGSHGVALGMGAGQRLTNTYGEES